MGVFRHRRYKSRASSWPKSRSSGYRRPSPGSLTGTEKVRSGTASAPTPAPGRLWWSLGVSRVHGPARWSRSAIKDFGQKESGLRRLWNHHPSVDFGPLAGALHPSQDHSGDVADRRQVRQRAPADPGVFDVLETRCGIFDTGRVPGGLNERGRSDLGPPSHGSVRERLAASILPVIHRCSVVSDGHEERRLTASYPETEESGPRGRPACTGNFRRGCASFWCSSPLWRQ